jgi:hypothetical protein
MQSENKSCEAICRLLDAYVSNELLTETNLDVLDHLDRCADCSAALNSRVEARTTLRMAVHQQTAPAELLHSIRNALPRRSVAGQQWAMAAVILLGLFLGGLSIWYVQPWGNSAAAETERLLNMGLAAYEHCPAEAGFESLGWEYDGLVEAIGEERPFNLNMTGAHRCVFDGKLFINVVLTEANEQAFLVVTEKGDEQLFDRRRAPALEASGVPVYTSTAGNFQIAGFETRTHLAFVVSKLASDANAKIASSIAALYAPSVRSTQKEARNGH